MISFICDQYFAGTGRLKLVARFKDYFTENIQEHLLEV